jgi:nucleotide-binding universal stress UspA family protein
MDMEDTIVTLGKYSYERAEIIKTILENDQIECFIQNVNLIQGAVASGVKVRIKEADLARAIDLLEHWIKPAKEKKGMAIKADVQEIPRILLPVDFSDYSRKAADLAFDWAFSLKAEITLVHTYFDPVINALPFTDTYMYDANLEELALDLKETGEKGLLTMKNYLNEKNAKHSDYQVVIKSVLLKGVAEDEIVRFSNVYNPTLIIMGTRGKDRKTTDLIGSVTAEVLDMAKVPVLAVPEDFEYKGLEDLKNVMYATNFEEADFKALDILERILKPIGVKIICAHVGASSRNEWDEVRMEGLSEHLRKKYQETDVVCDLVVNEDFYLGIERYVREKNISMLCLTAHRRNLIRRLLNPSIAKKMLFHSTTPLLVFHT